MNRLKLFSFAVAVALSTGFASCGDDPEPEPIPEPNTESEISIVGVWHEIEDEDDGDCMDFLQFDADGRHVTYCLDYDSDYGDSDAEVDKWSLNGNILCLYGNEYHEVALLTKTNLVLVDDEGDKETYERISESELEGILSQYDNIRWWYN